jgi:hypothetical protein
MSGLAVTGGSKVQMKLVLVVLIFTDDHVL